MQTEWKKGPTPGFHRGGGGRGGDIPVLSPELSESQSACFLRQVYSCNTAPTEHFSPTQKSMVTECQRLAVSLSNKNDFSAVPFRSVARTDLSDTDTTGIGGFPAKKKEFVSRSMDVATSNSLSIARLDVVAVILHTKSIAAPLAGDAASMPRKIKFRILHPQVELPRNMTDQAQKTISFLLPSRRAFGPALTPCKRGPRLKANSPARSLRGGFYGRSPARPRAIRDDGEYRPHTAKIGGCHG